MCSDSEINGWRLPTLLLAMIDDGRWKHPGDEVMQRTIPFLRDAVDFLTIDGMRRESTGRLADDPDLSKLYHERRGNKSSEPIELPWLDADKAVFIAVNRVAGEDVAIVLDYRGNPSDPRIVASNWTTDYSACLWREVAVTFSDFVRMIGIGTK